MKNLNHEKGKPDGKCTSSTLLWYGIVLFSSTAGAPATMISVPWLWIMAIMCICMYMYVIYLYGNKRVRYDKDEIQRIDLTGLFEDMGRGDRDLPLAPGLGERPLDLPLSLF